MITKDLQLIRCKSFMKGKSFAIMSPVSRARAARMPKRVICARSADGAADPPAGAESATYPYVD
jgi:hypothetical protein